MPPYYPQPRPPNYGGYDNSPRIADLIMRRGAIQAQGAQASGDIWGNAFANIGNTLAGGITQHAAQTQQRNRAQAVEALFAGGRTPEPGEVIRVFGPDEGLKVLQGLKAVSPATPADAYNSQQERLRDAARGVSALPPEQWESGYQFAAQGLVRAGVVKPEEIPPFAPEIITQLANYGQEPGKEEAGFTLTPGQQRFDSQGRPIAAVPAAPQDPPRPQVVGRSLVGPDGKVIYRDPEPAGGGSPSFQAKEVLGDDGQTTMANFDARTGRYTDTVTGQQIRRPRPIPSAAEGQDARKFKQAGPILAAVSELSERINTYQGVIASARGEAEKAKAKINLNDDVAEYESLTVGFTPLVARALGHTGVLTQQDVDSVRKLFPRPEDSKSLRDRKVARITSIIQQLESGAAPVAPGAPAAPRNPFR